MGDQMWREYHAMQPLLLPNAVTFSILTHRGDGDEDSRRALNEAKKFNLNWDEMSHRVLKGFWRTAERIGDLELIEELRPIMESKQENVRVTAIVQLDDSNETT